MSDDPIFDGTDGAHPARWRGHDHAAAQLVAQRDAARDQATAATADAMAAERERDALMIALSAMLDMATRLTAQRDALRDQVEGRAAPPTDAEIDALEAEGGWWLLMPDDTLNTYGARDAKRLARWHRERPDFDMRWRCINEDRVPRPWPVVTEASQP
jgi:hypothetical protein